MSTDIGVETTESGFGISEVGITGAEEFPNGSDIGDGNGDSSGKSKRGRGRPKGSTNKNSQTVVNILTGEPEIARRKGQKTPAELELAGGIAGVMTGIAMFTGHSHWARDTQSCIPLARPLTIAIERMPDKLAKKIGDMTLPISLLWGFGLVVLPSISEELKGLKNVRLKKSITNRAVNAETKQSTNGESINTETSISEQLAKLEANSGVTSLI